MLQRRRRAPARGRRLRARGDRRGGAPGRAVRRCEGRPRRERADDRRRRRRAARRSPRPRPARRRHRRRQRRRPAAQRGAARAGTARRSRRRRRQRRCRRRRWPACSPAPGGGTSSPTTCCRASVWSPRSRRARPSARPSSPTSSAARGCRAGAGSPSSSGRPRRMPCCAASRCWPTSWAGTCSSSTSAARRPTSTRSSPRRGRTPRSSARSSARCGTPAPSRRTSACAGRRRGGGRGGRARADSAGRHRAPVCRARRLRHRAPGRVGGGVAAEEELAATAAVVAVRRHGRPPHPSERPRPLADVGLVVGSGGVLRHAPGGLGDRVLGRVTADHGGGWRVPDAASATGRHGIRAVRRRAARRPAPGGRGGPARDLSPGRRWHGEVMTDDWPWAAEFEPRGTYLNSATMGLPPRATLDALAGAIEEWRRGRRPRARLRRGHRERTGRVRAAGARTGATVAIGSQVSALVSLRRGGGADGVDRARARGGVHERDVPVPRAVGAGRPGA